MLNFTPFDLKPKMAILQLISSRRGMITPYSLTRREAIRVVSLRDAIMLQCEASSW